MPRNRLIGKTVLIGLTNYDSKGEFLGQRQMFGTIAAVHRVTGIQVALDNGGTFTLPPDPKVLTPAPKGDYRLHSTGKVARDPDYLCTHDITEPTKH
jgi:hypothetical protein